MKTSILLLAAATALASLNSQAAVIAAWDMSGQPGDQGSMSATSSSSGIGAASIGRGDSLNASSGSDSFNSSGWSGSETGDYISFSLTVDEGYLLHLASLELITRSSNTGPGSLGLFSSLDGFSAQLGSIEQSGSDVLSSSIDLSPLGGFAGGIEFRLLELGNTQADGVGDTSASGTFRLLNGDSGFTRFEGELALTPVPLPASAWLFGSALAALGARRRLKT